MPGTSPWPRWPAARISATRASAAPWPQPIGAPPLRELARGRRDAVILVDDISRPTPAYRILPYILEELALAGLDEDHIIVIAATGTHRPFRRQEWVMKDRPGADRPAGYPQPQPLREPRILWHLVAGHPHLGQPRFRPGRAQDRRGHDHAARRTVFGGGSKMVLPGVCGRETISVNHNYCPGAQFAAHTQEVGRIAGWNTSSTRCSTPTWASWPWWRASRSQPLRAAWSWARDCTPRRCPRGMDIIVCNAWPKDNDAHQISLARVPLFGTRKTGAQAGRHGGHGLGLPGGRGLPPGDGPGHVLPAAHRAPGGRGAHRQRRAKRCRHSNILFAPGVNAREVRLLYGDQYLYCTTWDEVLAMLEARYGAHARVGVFPYGALQHAAG